MSGDLPQIMFLTSISSVISKSKFLTMITCPFLPAILCRVSDANADAHSYGMPSSNLNMREIKKKIDHSLTNELARKSKLKLKCTCNSVCPGLAYTCVELRWLALSLVEIKIPHKSTQAFIFFLPDYRAQVTAS